MIVDRYAKGSRIGLDVDGKVALDDDSVFIDDVEHNGVAARSLDRATRPPGTLRLAR
jgi:hypothetical protein